MCRTGGGRRCTWTWKTTGLPAFLLHLFLCQYVPRAQTFFYHLAPFLLVACFGTSFLAEWFWDIVESFSQENRARLLQFTTGSARVPTRGFKVGFDVNMAFICFFVIETPFSGAFFIASLARISAGVAAQRWGIDEIYHPGNLQGILCVPACPHLLQ